jgi:hypothetical protein
MAAFFRAGQELPAGKVRNLDVIEELYENIWRTGIAQI